MFVYFAQLPPLRVFSCSPLNRTDLIMKLENPTVHFSTINTIKNNAITNWYDLSWTQLVDIIIEQKHIVTENKDVTLISPWLYKTLEQGAKPRRLDDGQLWEIDGKPVVGRYADNVLGTDLLMFDFDGQMSISQAKHVFSTWMYVGYTSYSHMSHSKDGKDCFRVIVPLKQFVTAEQLVERRQSIYGSFVGVDTSCLSLARSFYVPSCAPERTHLSQIWQNHGDLFDVLNYAPDIQITPLASAVIHRPIDKQQIIDALLNVHLGNEPEWFNVAVALVSNDFTVDDFIQLTTTSLMNQKDAKQCIAKWKTAQRRAQSGKTMTIGYLINLCKKHGTWESANKRAIASTDALFAKLN